MNLKRILFLTLALGVFGCALDNSAPMEVSVSFQGDLQGTASTGLPLTDFDCVFVNIIGPGIESTIAQSAFGAGAPKCIRTGIVSPVVELDPDGTSFGKISILAGENRIVQVLAFKSNLNRTRDDRCPTQYLPDYFKNPGVANWEFPSIYEIGRADKVSLYRDTKLEIYKTPVISVDLVDECPSGT